MRTQVLSTVKFMAMVIGTLLQSAVFTAVFLQIFSTSIKYDWGKDDERSSQYNGFMEQAFFYFAHYMTFPTIAFLYLTRVIRDFVLAEALYVVAGVVSKMAIFWLVFATVRDFGENWTRELHKTPNVSWPAVRLTAIILPLILLAGGIVASCLVILNVARVPAMQKLGMRRRPREP